MRNQLKDLGRLRFELEKDEIAATNQPADNFPVIAQYTWEIKPGFTTTVYWRTFKALDGTWGIIPQGTPPIGFEDISKQYIFNTWLETVLFIKQHLPTN